MTTNIFKPNNDTDFRSGIAYYFRNKNEYCEFNEFYDVDSIGQHNDINSHTKISTWDTSNVTNMDFLFQHKHTFNEDLSKWNLQNVTSMKSMFENALCFNYDISKWNTSKVTCMSNMFNGATRFNSDISMWDVSNVIYFDRMFQDAQKFNQNISVWNTSNGTDFSYMFMTAYSFRQNIKTWMINKFADLTNMFYCAVAMTVEYDDDDNFNITPSTHFFNDCDSYFIGPTKILMADGRCKHIRNICSGDYVVEDINTFKVNKVEFVEAYELCGKCYCIKKKYNDDFLLSSNYASWAFKYGNKLKPYSSNDYVDVDSYVYGLRFSNYGTYYANGVKVDSVKPVEGQWKWKRKIRNLINWF